MYFFETKLRVRYAETDQMGFAYYGSYAQYYEVGRVELFRSLGFSYKTIEKMGFALPVINWNISYKKPAFYDDELTIKTIINKVPSKTIVFDYEIYNEANELLNIGQVTLMFVNILTNKTCTAPQLIIDSIKKKLT
tara:strand:+ start:7942 stop:8349 length:408 start_codon:yes stop_codon:yes gene_type:complete